MENDLSLFSAIANSSNASNTSKHTHRVSDALWVLRRRDPDKRGKGKRDRNKLNPLLIG